MRRKTILIIHKDDQTRREMHDILSHFDFELIYASDGLHGLHAAKLHQPDLIITDIDIAVLNGLDMGKMLRKEELTQNISIIFLHNNLNIKFVKLAKSLDARAFLIKPYLNNSLIYTIKQSLGAYDLHVNKHCAPARYEDCETEQLARVQYA